MRRLFHVLDCFDLILARRLGTSNAASDFSADQLSAAFIGGG
jgi:hypothetical protein